MSDLAFGGAQPDVALPSITRTFVSMKLRILRNAFHGDKRLRIGMTLMILGSLVGAAFSFHQIWSRRDVDPVTAADRLVLQFNLIFAAWVFGPLFSGGVDDTLDPSRVNLFPLPSKDLRRGFIAASLTGYVPVATMLGLTGVMSFAHSIISAIVLLASGVTMVAMSLFASRALAVVLALSGRSRRGRDIGVLLASSLGALLFIGGMSTSVLTDKQYDIAVDVARWFPAGWIAQSLVDTRENLLGPALLRIVAMAALAWVLLQVWINCWCSLNESAPNVGSRNSVTRFLAAQNISLLASHGLQ
jgi:ABC-2 type transport system permease protein